MADGAGCPWPQSLLPQKVPQARILTYGYDSRVVGLGPVSTNRLVNHATTMLHRLVGYRAENNTVKMHMSHKNLDEVLMGFPSMIVRFFSLHIASEALFVPM